MSVLEFIASLKWPITVLLLVGLASWRLRRNPDLGNAIRALIGSRSIRLNIAGQEVELGEAAGAATVAAAPDEALAEVGSRRDAEQDITEIRREAVEEAMNAAALYGWNEARSGAARLPELSLQWDESGRPEMGVKPMMITPILVKVGGLVTPGPGFFTHRRPDAGAPPGHE